MEQPNVYLFGGCGEMATADFIDEKSRMYPEAYPEERIALLKSHCAGTTFGYDCSGLIKNYLMGGYGNCRYDPFYDMNVFTMIRKTRMLGSMDDLPQLPGVLVTYRRHVGIYDGNGRVIESRPGDDGITGISYRKTEEGSWNQWILCPGLEYRL